MNYLLDTHAFLWTLFSPEKLSSPAAQKIKAPENDVAVSVITFWEISLKCALGKLELKGVGPEKLPGAGVEMGISLLAVRPSDAASFHKLPVLAHKAPFDRFLVWQAIQQKMILISKDPEFKSYHKFGLKTH
ncbi:MAG: type II toxin-antitoxin system VapC family toxin [Deltaproteobacteria bacterium]|nr:type II toxin-antitoxin system VapC family toxin [Deltaproteobacteria bacterium]MBW2151174.1 type II toxin-antitoxin system VapC family toxin [Deltaproteobacteria bacterium]